MMKSLTKIIQILQIFPQNSSIIDHNKLSNRFSTTNILYGVAKIQLNLTSIEFYS